MIILEIVTTSIALLAFGLLSVLAGLRLRSNKAAALHLFIFAGFGFFLSLFRLMTTLNITALTEITYNQLGELALLAMILAFGALTLNFLNKKKNVLISYWGGAIVILLLWGLFAFNVLTNTYLIPGITYSQVLLALGWVLAVVTAFVALSTEFKKQQSAKHLNRLRYWLTATALMTVSGLVLFISPALFYWAGVFMIIIGSALVGYTVLSYHTPDLNRLVGRALLYCSVTGAIAVIFYLSLALTIIVSRSPLDRINLFFWSVIAAIFLAIITRPLWLISNRVFNRIIFGKKRRDDKQVIRHYSQRVSTALDIQRLADIVIDLMVETLGIEQGVVFVNQRQSGNKVSLHPISSVGVSDLTTGQFSVDSLFIDYFRNGKNFLHQYDIDVLPEFGPLQDEERNWLSATRMELYVPILRNRELVGMLTFGPRSQGTAYYEEDLDLMVALADQAALAMDSARLFERLAVINQEVGSLSEQLAGMDQTKSDFLSIASHELRTPLTHIHGYSRMLLELTEDELQDPAYIKTLIQGIAKGSDRMKSVVDMMFDVTEANVGDLSLFLGPVALAEVIDQAARPFLPALDERRIAFGQNGLKDLPIIEADGTRLVQAFENLMGNAIKYTPDGGLITVEGRSIIMDDVGSAVEIMVADSGIGIDPEFQERIFEKFFRIDDTEHHSTGKTKFKGAGPGLGLTLVKGIAEAHGGKVWVESLGVDEVNFPGSKFFFVIPLHPVTVSQEDKPKQSQIETVHWRSKDLKPPANGDGEK